METLQTIGKRRKKKLKEVLSIYLQQQWIHMEEAQKSSFHQDSSCAACQMQSTGGKLGHVQPGKACISQEQTYFYVKYQRVFEDAEYM